MTEPGSARSRTNMQDGLDLFVGEGDLSPDTAAFFVASLADSERTHKAADDQTNFSPATKKLFERNDYLDKKFPEGEAKQRLKHASAKAYVNYYRSKANTESSSRPGKRKLGFDNSTSPASCKIAKMGPPTVVSPVDEVKKTKNTSTKKTKNVPWQKLREHSFQSLDDCRDFIKKLGPLKSLRTETNTDKETNVKGKHSLYGCGGNCRARLYKKSYTVRVYLEDNCTFGCTPTEEYHNRSYYSDVAAVDEQSNIDWDNVQSKVFDSIGLAKDHLTSTHGSLRNKRTKTPRKGLTRYEYECTVEGKPGRCKARVDHVEGKPVNVRVYADNGCKCKSAERNGLPRAVKSALAALYQEHPTSTPKSLTSAMMKKISCEFNDINVHCNKNRQKVQNQLKRHIEYLKKQNAAEGKIKCTGELSQLHETYKFHLPKEPSLNISDEVALGAFGTKLYDDGLLQIFDVEDIDCANKRKYAYRHQTLLDGRRDPLDESRSSAEERLYRRINELQKKFKLEAAWEQTTVMSSLALLWNLKQCEDLDWNVSISCDGTAHTVANDFKLLNLGCFNVSNMKGAPIFRPFMLTLGPEEAEIYFAIGVVSVLKYARRLFGIKDIKFNGLMITDHAPAFVNVLRLAFPTSLCGSCYPHITRKLQKGKGTSVFE